MATAPKLARTLFLMTALAGLSVSTLAVSAQDKAAPKKKAAAGSIEIIENKGGKYYFTVRNADGKLLAMSSVSGYASKVDAEEAIDELKAVVASAKVTMGKKKTGKEKDAGKDDKMDEDAPAKKKKGGE